MDENVGGAGGDAVPKAVPRPRPTIALPQRPPFEALFLRGGGGAWGASPGPMTLVSSFFDPESECQSFSQLLAGAIASPVAMQPPTRLPSSAAAEGGVALDETRATALAWSPFYTVPPVLSPGGLLDSPSFFANFGISHQEALAQVTALAVQARSHMHREVEYPSSLPAVTTSSMAQSVDSDTNMEACQQRPLLISDADNITFRSTEGSHSEEKSQPAAITGNKPAEDGYNWRKYGQKQVKSSEYPRSYYKCTYAHCPVKKKVECSYDGQVTEIVYKGQHNHQPPSRTRRAKESGILPTGSSESNGKNDFSGISETSSQVHPKGFSRLNETANISPTSEREKKSDHGASKQVSGSSDGDEVGETDVRAGEGHDNEPDLKRRKLDTGVTETTSQRTLAEPKIIVQTTSEVDLLDDGYRWRKYGQKVVRGNPNPRSYYKCTFAGCNVRKHIERAATDPKSVVTTYEGKHNHDVPAAKKSSHSIANAAAANSLQLKAHNTMSDNQVCQNGRGLKNNGRHPAAPRQLKEEHEIT